MPGMPYSLEVGAILSALADKTENEPDLVDLLNRLNAGETPGDLLNTATFTVTDPQPPHQQIPPAAHYDRDWLGHGYPPGKNPNGVGWWVNWTGEVDEVVRTTMKRAFELALGVPTGAKDLSKRTRCWPLVFNWACATPMFQGWVSWMGWDDVKQAPGVHERCAGGIVMVTFTTPGNGEQLYMSPRRPAWKGPAPDYEDDPAPTLGEYGMWVIGQERTINTGWVGKKGFENSGYRLGDGFIPRTAGGPVYRSDGKVIVVSPAEIDGGWLHAGRTW